MKTKRLGELLVDEGMITEEDLSKALEAQKLSRKSLGATLIELNFLSEETLYHFLAMQHNLEFVDIGKTEVKPEVLKTCPEAIARRLNIFPLEKEGNKLKVAVCNPDDPALLNLTHELVVVPSTEFVLVLASENAIKGIIERHFASKASSQGLSEINQEIFEQEGLAGPEGEAAEFEMVEERKIGSDDDSDEVGKVDDAPVIKWSNHIISQAIANHASDIHINVYEKKLVLRCRIDGSLVEFAAPPIKLKKALASRMKLMAKLNPMERRRAQDGRIKFSYKGRQVDLRIAVLPCIWGENITLRIIDQGVQSLDIKTMGLLDEQAKIFDWAYHTPYGMILVTGPTGCGKTTTLYSVIKEVNDPKRNIMTVEDPVEYRLPHIIQIQVNPDAGLTFANVLRAFLRQDPNVMLVGEIRDGETADIAIKAALTGHLVISTLHTNDGPSTIARLVNMGVDPVYVGTSVLMVSSQKLLRKICEHCRERWEPDKALVERAHLTMAGIDGVEFFHGKGCEKCHDSGYSGRFAVHEVLKVGSAVRAAIFRKANLNELRDVALREGMKTMREVALTRWKEGRTTLEEVLAETQYVVRAAQG